MLKTIARWFGLILLGVLSFALGLVRQEYIINIIDASRPFLLLRKNLASTFYPLSFSGFLSGLYNDPHWTSNIIYLLYPACSTFLAITLLYKNKNYLKITFLFYVIGLVLLAITIITSILFNNYTLGYGMAQQVKKIYQEPYVSLLLIGGFYWDQRRSERGETERGARKEKEKQKESGE